MAANRAEKAAGFVLNGEWRFGWHAFQLVLRLTKAAKCRLDIDKVRDFQTNGTWRPIYPNSRHFSKCGTRAILKRRPSAIFRQTGLTQKELHVSDIFQSKLFSYLAQPYQKADIYHSVFKLSKPKIMGESPYLNARDEGISLALEKDDRIKAVFLYAEGIEEFSQYKPPLPGGLSFETSRALIRSKLGEPAFAGEAGGTGIMAIEHSFDRYESSQYYIRIEYADGGSGVRLVTLGLNG
jgi:hypothetical protein